MPVAPDIWESIESRIMVKKESSRFWFFLLIPLLFTPILFAGLLWKSDTSQEFVPNENLGITPVAYVSNFVDRIPQVAGSSISDLNVPQRKVLPIGAQLSTVDRKVGSLFALESNEQGSIPELLSDNNVNIQSGLDNSRATLTHNSMHSLEGKQFPLYVKRGILSKNPKFADPGAECHDFMIYEPGFYAYAEYSSDLAFQSLKAKNSNFVDYVDKRNDTESLAYSFSTRLGLGYQFDNGLFAESGLSYDQINMTFKFADENAIKNSTVITIDTMILNDIDTIIHADTLVVQQTGLNDVTAYNRFSQIDIPVVVGFEFPLNDKMRLSLKGGVMINISSSNSGYMVGLNDFPITYGSSRSSDNEYFKTNVGYSYTGGLNLEADLSQNFSIYAGANIRHYPNTFSLRSNPVHQKYTKVGLTTGIKYRL